MELKKAVGKSFGKVFNESFDNFVLKIKENDQVLDDNSLNVEAAEIYPGCYLSFTEVSIVQLIKVRVIKRKYQFEKENVKSGTGLEAKMFVHLEVSPHMLLSEFKKEVKRKLHCGQRAPV